MITEIAQIDVKPGSEKDFEAAIAKAEPIFRRCKGWKSFELHRGIEKPSRYRLHIKWETLENHTVDFSRLGEFRRMASAGRAAFR
jgi:heme-degrading monooxygenase HmoA